MERQLQDSDDKKSSLPAGKLTTAEELVLSISPIREASRVVTHAIMSVFERNGGAAMIDEWLNCEDERQREKNRGVFISKVLTRFLVPDPKEDGQAVSVSDIVKALEEERERNTIDITPHRKDPDAEK